MRTDRGLAGPVGPEEPEHRACFDLERDAVEGAHVAAGEDLHEVVRLDRRSRGEELAINKET